MPAQKIHPEIMPGEVWLGNFTSRDFRECGRKTKRRGDIAFDCFGSPLDFWKFGYAFLPVFVERQELIDDGLDPAQPLTASQLMDRICPKSQTAPRQGKC